MKEAAAGKRYMWNHAAGVSATSNGIKVDRDMGGEGMREEVGYKDATASKNIHLSQTKKNKLSVLILFM